VPRQGGSVKVLEKFVSRWHKRLWRYAYKLTGDSEAARDVTQDAKGDGTNVIDIDIKHIDCLNLTFESGRSSRSDVLGNWANARIIVAGPVLP
jgi:hypothetical protein